MSIKETVENRENGAYNLERIYIRDNVATKHAK